MRLWGALIVGLIALCAVPATAFAHPERKAFFPDGTKGEVPKYRAKGPSRVVCKPDSRARTAVSWKGSDARSRKLRRSRLRLIKRCHYSDIQAAINDAQNGDRILIMPGVYNEKPSLEQHAPFDYNAVQYDKAKDQTPCKDDYQDIYSPLASGLAGRTRTSSIWVPSYEYQYKCPNAENLIAIVGDGPDADRVCDTKCNLQIEGMGRSRDDVLISGSRAKLNVIRADRADGIYLKNFTVELSDFNNVYVLETNGFRLDNIVSRYAREYDFLSFTSDHGIYENLEAYGAGDSGVYPGSGPEGHCQRYGIEIRNVDSHDNTLGYSGTAGNGVWAHDNKFHHNAAGLTTDSFAYGHPGMPQDCAKWEHNFIYSNNQNFFDDAHDQYCSLKNRPMLARDPKYVCPTFQAPVGTGALIGGGNGNIVRDNYIYDNWRDGIKLLWVPANFRGESDAANEVDTSFSNTFANNHMGVRPDGTRDLNGNDFWWDEEGKGNCWDGNVGPGGSDVTSNVLGGLPRCPGAAAVSLGRADKTASQVSCSQWNPQDDQMRDPPGCDWFIVPPEPQ